MMKRFYIYYSSGINILRDHNKFYSTFNIIINIFSCFILFTIFILAFEKFKDFYDLLFSVFIITISSLITLILLNKIKLFKYFEDNSNSNSNSNSNRNSYRIIIFMLNIIIHILVWSFFIFIGVFILDFFNVLNYFDIFIQDVDVNMEDHMDLTKGNNNNPDINNSNNSNNINNSGNNSNNSNNNEKVVSVDIEDKEDDKYYNFSIRKGIVDKVVKEASAIGKDVIQNVVPNVGAGAAAGTAAAGALKVTANMPIASRLAIVGSVAAVTAAGTKLGLDLGASMSRQVELSKMIKNSRHGDIDPERVPSPDPDMIHCVLEKRDIISPLEEILRSQLSLNLLIFFLVIIFLILIFNRYVLRFNLDMVNYLNKKYVPNKYKDIITNYTAKGLDYNSKFIFYMFIFNTIIIILLLLINIYVSYELSNNTGYYVEVYNYVHTKKSIILLLSINSHNITNKIRNYSSINVLPLDLEIHKTMDINEILDKFGNYDNYLNTINKNKASKQFIQEHYPDLINDQFFNIMINTINPIARLNVKFILDLYEKIIIFNNLKDKIISYAGIWDDNLTKELFIEYKKARKEILGILSELGHADTHFDLILNNFAKSVKKDLILEASLNFKKSKEKIKFEEEYKEMWKELRKLITKDISVTDMQSLDIAVEDPETVIRHQKYLVEMEELFFKVYFSMKFCIENDVKGFNSINSFYSPYYNKIITYQKSDKVETYKIKKGETRKKRMRTGLIIQGYRDMLQQCNNDLKDLMLKFLLDKENIENLIKEKDNVLNEIENTNIKINKDFYLLLNKIYNVLDVNKFVYELSRNLSDKNIIEQCQAFKKYTQGMFTKYNITHDELINIYNLVNNFNLNYVRKDESTLKKENSLSMNSFLYVKCKDIINNKNISIENRQVLLETFILSYEKEFTLNIIKNMDNNIKDFKLITRIYKHSTPQFINRIQNLIEDFKKRNFELYHKSIKDPGRLGDILVLALFLANDAEEITNIILSKVVRLVGLSGGIKQTDLLAMISDELFITLKYSLKNKNLVNKLSRFELEILNNIYANLEFVTVESKFRFGNFLIDFIFEEFSYIFSKNNYFENGEQFIYITITPEYLRVLTACLFNPIKLPMINQPKIWEFNEIEGNLNFTKIGGYYLEEFNELNKNNNIVRKNSFNKYNSLISEQQVNSINFLNSKGFNINKEMLDYVVLEWNKNEKSIIFNNFNKLHSLTDELDKLSSIKKKEVISHNSKYWSFSNIINIALLMRDQIIYFPTFLDFRGRIYPTPNYLSYQSNDLARSLLLFSNYSNLEDPKDYTSILNQVLTEDIYNKDKNTNKKINTLSDIEYLKLYLANVYGKNKLSRKGRIDWVNKNIEEMIKIYEEDIDLFNSKYVNLSKEPFQFVACFLAYFKYIRYNELINIPILFDATCSGIQHLSALSKDTQIAKLVNLLENDEPSDFYQYCIYQILEIIKSLPEEHKIIKNKLEKLYISRKLLKQSIMTIPYNVTNKGISDKLSSKFNKLFITNEYKEKLDLEKITLKELKSKNFEYSKEVKGLYIYIPTKEMCIDTLNDNDYLYFTSSEMLFFANIIKRTVINIIPSFNELKIYFDKIIVILQKIGLPLFWETPSGMSVSMSTVKMSSKRVKNNFLRRTKPISLLIPTEQIDYRHIKTGLMPNFIHSLDASNIHILIKNIYKYNLQNINLYTIHDCFASDIKNIRIIELLVKHSFIELYFRKDYLKSIHLSFLSQIQSYTEIFEDNSKNGDSKYILIGETNKSNKSLNLNKTEKLILPRLPNFEWTIDKDKILYEILFNSYFIS